MDDLKRASFRKTHFGCTCEYCGGVNRVETREGKRKLDRQDRKMFEEEKVEYSLDKQENSY